jgi:hypothetical protein
MSQYQVVAPRVVSPLVTLQLNTQVGRFYPGSRLVMTAFDAQNLVNTVPQCVSLSTPIVPGAYVVVSRGYGCYPPYYPYGPFYRQQQDQ